MTLQNHIKAFGLAASLLFVSTAVTAKDITVFAAASLRGALDEIAPLSPDPVTFSYAGSGLIARQASQGAPADVVVLAHPNWMDWLANNAPLIAGTRADVTTNTLTLIAGINTPEIDATDVANWLQTVQIAMGQRDAVPAGIYAKQWLTTANLWDTVQPNLVETDNVRLALALVARGEVPAGITYNSDAISEPRVRIIQHIDPTQHSPIRYPAAALTDNGRAFVTLLKSPEAQAIFRAHGFAPLDQD